ncbi:MAG: helix-turn-helix domain-containing protein [Hansschlegelia sp.]
MAQIPALRRHHQGPQALGPLVDHRTVGGPEGDSLQREPSARFEVCADGRCPIEDTLNVIAGRWKIVILWWLQAGELRFGELRRHMPSVTPKMLTQQLRQMEQEGLVQREVFAQVPPKVVYSLTERGQSLRPILQSLYDWSVGQPAK